MIKLKDILNENSSILTVYHGTGEKFRRFNLKNSTQGIIWFTSNKEKIIKGEAGAQGRGFIITAEVTINNPAGWDEYDKLMLAQIKSMGHDGVILDDGNDGFDCFVFSPKQVKIKKVEKV
jgi:hypothetical protein